MGKLFGRLLGGTGLREAKLHPTLRQIDGPFYLHFVTNPNSPYGFYGTWYDENGTPGNFDIENDGWSSMEDLYVSARANGFRGVVLRNPVRHWDTTQSYPYDDGTISNAPNNGICSLTESTIVDGWSQAMKDDGQEFFARMKRDNKMTTIFYNRSDRPNLGTALSPIFGRSYFSVNYDIYMENFYMSMVRVCHEYGVGLGFDAASLVLAYQPEFFQRLIRRIHGDRRYENMPLMIEGWPSYLDNGTLYNYSQPIIYTQRHVGSIGLANSASEAAGGANLNSHTPTFCYDFWKPTITGGVGHVFFNGSGYTDAYATAEGNPGRPAGAPAGQSKLYYACYRCRQAGLWPMTSEMTAPSILNSLDLG